MSDKRTKPSSANNRERSPFQSGRPDRIKAALRPKKASKISDDLDLPSDDQHPRNNPMKTNPYDTKNMAIGRQVGRKTRLKTSGDNAGSIQASQRAEIGGTPKRRPSDNLAEILARQKSDKTSSKRFNNLSNSANDDIAHSAQLLEEIKSDSNKKPIFAALLFTLIWVTLCIAIGLSFFNSGIVDVNAVSFTSFPVLLAITAVLFIPCILSWGVAVFLYRARELHQISLSLAYTALHLTQPEDMAGESIATIGQAVRREVAAMGDGIDRAISRATTLENKFRNEVGNIQGFYKNNERVFHKIISDLQNERDLMSSTSLDLEARLPTILDKLKDSSFDFSKIVQSADQRFTALAKTADSRLASLGSNIADKTNLLKNGLDRTIEDVNVVSQRLDESTKTLFNVTDKLGNVGNATTAKLEKINSNFKRQTTDLGFATSAILKANEEINTALQSRHEHLSSSAEHLLQNAEQINNLLSSFASVIDKSFLNAEDRSQNMQKILRDAAQDSANILQTEMTKIRKATSSETQKLIELLRESSFTATTALRDDISSIISGSQSEVQSALTMLLKESQNMCNNLKDEADNITQMMQNQMVDIRDSAIGNTEESLTKIRKGHEASIINIIGRIDEAGERLTGTAENLNLITGRMDSEMEITRGHLSEQVARMPIEAKHALQEMQVYIDDQVSALAELAKSVGGLGTVVAKPQAPKRRIAEQKRMSDTRTRPTQRPITSNSPPIRTTRERSRPAPKKTTTSRSEPPAENRNKWEMPDLLSRASSSQPLPEHLQPLTNRVEERVAPTAQSSAPRRSNRTRPNTELHSVESLNAISLDLAKALDHEAPDELWARYRNGERNVFTRRLYTLRGQKLFDEVSYKYRNDANFGRDVDRYIGDFEDLLTKIYEQDRDSMLIDTYLSSETGKIYLMLAHASGRLD